LHERRHEQRENQHVAQDLAAVAGRPCYATADDAEALRRLAALDSARALQGAVLVAEVAGEPWAAISLEDYHAVADPFRPSADLVWLLVERARDLERAQRSRGGRHGRALRLRTAHAR
jgi:hypothetical protein